MDTIEITPEFVREWVEHHDRRLEGQRPMREEREVREWLLGLGEPKYLDKEHFVTIGEWKTPRQRHNYLRNSDSTIREVTRRAYLAEGDSWKLSTLEELYGVGVAVGGTILHFLHPEKYAIFDVRVRKTLKKAGKWEYSEDDDSDYDWLVYIDIMKRLSSELGFSLRELDKALWEYDKYGGQTNC